MRRCSSRRIPITFHGRPDGDALGSGLALRLWLEGRGARAEVVNADGADLGMDEVALQSDRALIARPLVLRRQIQIDEAAAQVGQGGPGAAAQHPRLAAAQGPGTVGSQR